MPVHIALLRGINVGRNVLKMERLRALCAELGATVRTYVQSGNVVFAAKGPASRWSKALEQKLVGEARLAVSVMVRTAAEMATVVANNPFVGEPGIDPARLAVAFLDKAPAARAFAAIETIDAGPDRYIWVGKEIHLYLPNGFARTKLTNNTFERLLSVRATSRNWSTVNALCRMANE
jgi:uncharacterized protein (DUF1697 family)